MNTSGYLVFWKRLSKMSNCWREKVVRSRLCFLTEKNNWKIFRSWLLLIIEMHWKLESIFISTYCMIHPHTGVKSPSERSLMRLRRSFRLWGRRDRSCGGSCRTRPPPSRPRWPSGRRPWPRGWPRQLQGWTQTARGRSSSGKQKVTSVESHFVIAQFSYAKTGYSKIFEQL